jgi:surface carbohydrate biosynthesis protein (TIGR04326 family)
MGIKQVREASYPMDRVLPVEALRYLYLAKVDGSERREINESNRTLLVTTGSLLEENKAQLRFLSEVATVNGLKKYGKIVIKAHPGLDIKELLNEIRLEFSYTIEQRHLSEIWSDIDVVFAANSTGVSLEAAWRGIPVIIMGAVDAMNNHPLSDIPEVKFVSNRESFKEQLENPQRVLIPKDFFFLDEGLIYWRRLLKESLMRSCGETDQP